MPQWDLFLAVTAVVLVAALVLAYRSQETLDRYDDSTVERSSVETADADEAVGMDTTSDATETEPAGSSSPATDEQWAFDEQGQPNRRREIELTAGLMMLNVAFTQGLIAVVLVGSAWLFAIPVAAFDRSLASVIEAGQMVSIGVAFGILLWLGNELSTTVADAVGAAHDEQVRSLLAPSTSAGWLALFGGVLPLIAVAEELLFRAALVGVPDAAGYGPSVWVLALVSSLAFALGHGAQGRVGVVVTGALGFVLAAGYVVSGSLLLVVVAHYVINALEFLVHELLGWDWVDAVLTT